jgi:glycosyltransferase involved in cell wall biosynthesis
MKIMLIGHACGPKSGSEPAITWNWATHLSRSDDVTVVTHPTERAEIEAHLRASPNPRLRFHWVKLPPAVDPWRPGRSRFIRLHYLLWQRLVMRVVRREAAAERYDYVHYISWNTVSAAPDLRHINAPTVWGPLGGGQTPPLRFLRYLGRTAIPELLRAGRVKVLRFRPRFRRAARAAKPVLAINDETAALLHAVGAPASRRFLEVGIDDGSIVSSVRGRSNSGALVIAWVGRLEPHKGLPLALEALKKTGGDVRLEIAGDGYMRSAYQRLAEKLGVTDRIRFLGQLPRDQVRDLYLRADAFLFTSLRDSSGGVVFEAMASALPVVVPDHQGCAVHVPSDTGIKYPITRPPETVREIARAIERLRVDEDLRLRLASAALDHSRTLTWTNKIAEFKGLLAEEGIS